MKPKPLNRVWYTNSFPKRPNASYVFTEDVLAAKQWLKKDITRRAEFDLDTLEHLYNLIDEAFQIEED